MRPSPSITRVRTPSVMARAKRQYKWSTRRSAGSSARRVPSSVSRFMPVLSLLARNDLYRTRLVKGADLLFRIILILWVEGDFVKRFADLTEQEILALAITNEDEDSRIYRGFAEGLREKYAASAKVFDEMADEEVRHRTMLFELYRSKFGEYLPLIRRQDVKGFIQKQPLWLMSPLSLDEVRKFAENMEYEATRFYRRAAETTRDTSVRQLLVELAEVEAQHEGLAHRLGEQILTPSARDKEDETARRMFVLQYVQPGLAGLMDGSVSTLAPLFAAAFATHSTWE